MKIKEWIENRWYGIKYSKLAEWIKDKWEWLKTFKHPPTVNITADVVIVRGDTFIESKGRVNVYINLGSLEYKGVSIIADNVVFTVRTNS